MGASNSSEFKKKIFLVGVKFSSRIFGLQTGWYRWSGRGRHHFLWFAKPLKSNYSKQKRLLFSFVLCRWYGRGSYHCNNTNRRRAEIFGPNVFADPNVEKIIQYQLVMNDMKIQKQKLAPLSIQKIGLYKENNGAFEVAFVTAETRAVVAKLFW